MLRRISARLISLCILSSVSDNLFADTRVPVAQAGDTDIRWDQVVFPEPDPEQRRQACLREQIVVAPADVSMDEIRRYCAEQVGAGPEPPKPLESTAGVPESLQGAETTPESLALEPATAIRNAANNPFTLASHRTNYLLPVVYNPSPNERVFEQALDQPVNLDHIEVQFQLSVQVPVWRGFLGKASFLSVAYTNRSFWQAYNSDDSAPFRETNHEPELLMTWLNDWHLFGFENIANQLVINHQSNGRSEALSRSWNRVYAHLFFQRGSFLLGFKPWYRIKEDREEDDNPDIEKYLGHFELTGTYYRGEHTFGLMLRNNLRSDNHGALELRWSFPMGNRVRGYVKYFNGYGESLIDYDEAVQTLGVGFELARGFQ
ncbi:phospholipase A [Microbulbifer sp. TYP-18]|uniref:phospholipase A n=1 Tax=Microbulbifer sp. TYP-18 TaxID=3230024 RepID=UPI0034C66A05